jgi:peptidyl-prolyl cis-trans isomerase C
MKTYPSLLLSVALLLVAGCDQLQPQEEPAASAEMPVPPGTVLATVNGEPITRPVFNIYKQLRNSQKPGNSGDADDVVLDELISLEVMRQESINNGLDTEPSVVATLNQQQRTVLAGAAIKEFLAENPVSDEAVRELYDTQIGAPTMEYKARHILVKSREEAEEIIGVLDEGGDFETLAREKSTGPSGKSGGQLGWFSPSQMVKPFADATATLEKGSYTREPVETQFGWHVILLEESRENTPPAFEDIKDRLKILAANQQLQQHIRELRADATIKITEAAQMESAGSETGDGDDAAEEAGDNAGQMAAEDAEAEGSTE